MNGRIYTIIVKLLQHHYWKIITVLVVNLKFRLQLICEDSEDGRCSNQMCLSITQD